MLEPTESISHRANPEHVEELIQAMGEALNRTVVLHITSQADILSAIFTILNRMLKTAKQMEAPEDAEHNAHEIGCILKEFLLEFGTDSSTVN